MMTGTETALQARSADAIVVPDLVDFPEARDLLASIVETLRADGAMLSLHADDDAAPVVLHRAGRFGSDPLLARAAARLLADRADGRDGEGRIATARLDPAGADMLFTFFGCRESEARVALTVLPRAGDAPRPALPAAALRRMLPLLGAAFKPWLRRRREARERANMALALDGVEFGIVLVDRDGGICLTNDAADALLADGRFIRRRGRTLSAAQVGGTMKIQAAVAAAIDANLAANDPQGGPADAGLLQLTDSGDRLVMAAFPVDRPAAGPDAAAAMLVIHNPDRRPERMVGPVCRLFGLSAVETRLASHLVAGRSLAEASEAMRIKEQTARGYLKQVFLKAGVNRQSELVRLLVSSLINTGGRSAFRAI